LSDILQRDAHVLSFVTIHPWAIAPEWLGPIASVLARHAAGLAADENGIAAALVKRRNLPQPTGGGVAVIPVYGVIAPRAGMLTEMSGGTSFERLSEQLAQAMSDPKVSTIVFDVDSPGGSVAGATEFFAQVRTARATKPIIAHAQYTMASAAYWFASAATKVYASPSAMVGSVGVYTIHNDLSDALKALGVKRTYIAAGKYKAEGNETGPLSEDAHAHVKATVSAAHQTFMRDIAAGRGVPIGDVRNGFGEGRLVTADDALAGQMIDAIQTLDTTIARACAGETDATDRAADALPAPPAPLADDTMQEPSPATIQDRRRAYDRQSAELALLSL